MAIVFPTGLDVMTTVVDNTTDVLAVHFNDIRNAVEAIEGKTGIDDSAVTTSLDYLLKNITGGHDHDGTDSRRVSDFVSGDWIVSTVTTARSGWVNVTATYIDRFMRVNATPLGTGGINTHIHTANTFTGPNHNHGSAYSTQNHSHSATSGASVGMEAAQGDGDGVSGSNHHHTVNTPSEGAGSVTGSSGYNTGSISGNSASGDNVPAYVQCVIFQKS